MNPRTTYTLAPHHHRNPHARRAATRFTLGLLRDRGDTDVSCACCGFSVPIAEALACPCTADMDATQQSVYAVICDACSEAPAQAYREGREAAQAGLSLDRYGQCFAR